ncbi:uncharacterized protein LOC111706745 [Eurytemora carolleeae]|uniref:uncharacterized protein LOC111706745 n=1 Tax=Eurytemora carolleeae TaxID=1294199 RepID=UPI000C765D01|nr:uncharacterized protein LOC111706745 [Eurytemora carolleeae]|eukprot:XP_023335438.1 uncharacterized protein LOC111706745 [Eurytemora affinis]
MRGRFEILVLKLFFLLSPSKSALEVYKPIIEGSLKSTLIPEFLTVDQNQVVKITAGETLHLKCRVINLAIHHTVSWLRVSDVQVLTVGGLVFSSDPRIQIDVKSSKIPGSGTWIFRIREVLKQDEGVYQCQVNTEPATTLDITVHVSSNSLPDYDRFQDDAKEESSKELFSDPVEHSDEILSTSSLNMTLANSSLSEEVMFENDLEDENMFGKDYRNKNDDDTGYKENTENDQQGFYNNEFSTPVSSLTPGRALSEPNPLQSLLEPSLPTSIIQMEKSDEKGVQESADENALLQPILSLLTVAGFIIILGSIRSYYSSAKNEDDHMKPRSRTGTNNSRQSRIGTDDSRRSKTDTPERRKASSGRQKPMIDEEEIYLEIRRTTPLVQVVRSSPLENEKTTRKGRVHSETSDYSDSSGMTEYNREASTSRPVSKKSNSKTTKYAGINKTGARRSRERYLASLETLSSPSPLPGDTILEISNATESKHQEVLIKTHLVVPPPISRYSKNNRENPKRKINFNPFDEYSD